MKTCKVEGCINNMHARGLCSKHSTRLKRHGDLNYVSIIVGENRSINPMYRVYNDMKKRCYNTNAQNYQYYGWRGIKVCDRRLGLDGFRNFLEDMGERPKGYTLDRIDVNGNYEPSNCRWATSTQQAKNKTNNVIFNGEHASDAEKRLGLRKGGISSRINQGRSIEYSFSMPLMNRIRNCKTYHYKGETGTEAAKRLGLKKGGIVDRIRRGRTIERAFTEQRIIGRKKI